MTKNIRKNKRQLRTRKKVQGTKERPRLSVFRSNQYIYAQIIDDSKRQTILGVSEKNVDRGAKEKANIAKELGMVLAKMALDKKIKKVVFDRGSYAFHGKVKALAEGAREGGLKF